MSENKIGIIASDMRQIYMAQMLEEKGYEVVLWNQILEGIQQEDELIEEVVGCDNIILPVPVSRMQKQEKFLETLEIRQKNKSVSDNKSIKQTTCYGGVFSNYMREALDELKVEVVDVLLESNVAAANSVATSEGAIAELSSLIPINIEGANIAVAGFGKCGKVIAEKLYCMGAYVTIIARGENAINLARFFGFESYSFDNAIPFEKMDAIINTVPALVITKEVIDQLKKDAVVLDIASAPGGCDGEYCKKKKIPYRLALGLPGKYSPKTSAEILLEAMPF